MTARRTARGIALAGVSLALAFSATARADGGECSGGVCGTPQQSGGGGCGCGTGGPTELEGCDALEDQYYEFADDYDNDGLEDEFDNCPYVKNMAQADVDGDGVGDTCDNAFMKPNPDQLDTDHDGVGDVADPDADGDGVENGEDNCPLVVNPDQLDTDDDGEGDACDDDDDNDTVLDVDDNCPLVANPTQTPPRSMGNPTCDVDSDRDGRMDAGDNCPGVANADQADLDGDRLGDACDPDRDGDSVPDSWDNCPGIANPDQADSDRDGEGDACDARFCYVVDGGEDCLDPGRAFTVYSPPTQLETGQPYRLRLFANRESAPFRYAWEVLSRPGGSGAAVRDPDGVVKLSTPFEYHYLQPTLACFIPDEPGDYQIQLSADLVFEDPRGATNPRHSKHVVTITAEGESLNGCQAGPGRAPITGLLPCLGLLLALALRRRTR